MNEEISHADGSVLGRDVLACLKGTAVAALLLGLAACGGKNTAVYQPASAPKVTREVALENIGRNIILPTLHDVTTNCAGFEMIAREFKTNATQEVLARLREQWIGAYTAWCAVQWIPGQPYYPLGFYLWPPRPGSIEGALKGRMEYDAAYMKDLGAAATGMFTLEYLLFDQTMMVPHRKGVPVSGPLPPPAWELLTGTNGLQRRDYVFALAELVARQAREVEQTWRPEGGNAVAQFIGGGQDSLDKLFNRLLENTEQTAQGSLSHQIEFRRNKTFQPENARAMSSGASHRAVVAILQGVKRHYEGGDGAGVDDYLRTLDPALADRMKVHFEKTLEAARAITMPVEEAAKAHSEMVQPAADACHLLEITFKTDVVSRLGVTLTFIGTDGD